MAIHQPELCPEDPDSPGSSCQSHHGNTPARTVSGRSRQSGILLSVPSWQYTSQNCVRRIPTVRDPPVSPIMAIHQPELCPEDPDSPGSSCGVPSKTSQATSLQSLIKKFSRRQTSSLSITVVRQQLLLLSFRTL